MLLVSAMNFTFPAQSESELVFTISGLVLLLFGWIIFRLGSRLISIGLGAGFGFFFGEVLNVVLEIDRNMGLYITIGCSMVGALFAMFMIRAATNFLFALIGFLFGALIGRVGSEIYLGTQQMDFAFNSETGIIILATAGVTAIMAVWLQRLIMILITSYMGATFLVAGVDYLTMQPWAFPAVLGGGVFWQGFILGRIFKRRPKADRRSSTAAAAEGR
jgi:hypothetical protein